MGNPPYVVGISGGSASGKSHLLHLLRASFSPLELCVISQDHYYHGPEHQVRDARGKVNYDLPESLDLESFTRDLQQLIAGNSVKRREYLFQNEGLEASMLYFEPAPIIVIEGIFLFCMEEISRLLNLKIFMEAPADIMLQRRISRDVSERGVSREQLMYQWTEHVLPAYEKYLLPFRQQADIIINNGEHFNQSLKILEDHFRAIIRRK